jgi:carbonic anhydrase/acetyltransferase-like protein (isoleucine patch superfamily)
MKVALFATRPAGALAPITEFSCLALVTVACKPLIVHTVEALAMAGLTDVLVVVSLDADAVEAALADGARWGMQFEYVHAARRESDEELLQRIRHKLGEECLLVRGEILRSPIIGDFVVRSGTLPGSSVTATIAGIEAGLTLVKRRIVLEKSSEVNFGNMGAGAMVASRLEFPDASLSLLESFAAFHRAHLDILAGRFDGLIIPGRELANGVKVGRNTNLPVNAIRDVPVLIGSRCKIASNAALSGNVVISDDVAIDARAVLRSAVIMPHTYVGELVELDHAIVAGNRLIHVDTGLVASIADSFLLAPIRPEDIAARVRNFAERIAGAILLAATIWLWPIALVAAMVENPRRPIRNRLVLGNRTDGKSEEFSVFEFAVSIQALRYLPYLFAVAAGRLRLIGGEPVESDSTAVPGEGSEMARDKNNAGLFGLMWSPGNRQMVKRRSKVSRTRLRRPLVG